MTIVPLPPEGIIGLQQRMRQLGEIRIGHRVPTGRVSQKTGQPTFRPEKLNKFRLTSPSKRILEKVASLYGGTVQEWTPPNGGPKEWEVYTDTDVLPIIVPPRNACSQWFELYKGSRCDRRCDGRIEIKSDKPCMCDPNKRACSITTRLNVMLRDVPGLGVWLLTSHGWTAASELPPFVRFLATMDGYVDAELTLEEVRDTLDDGTTVQYMVPKIDIPEFTPAQLLAGQGAISPQAIAANQQHSVNSGQAPAIEAPAQNASAGFVELIEGASTRTEVIKIWEAAKRAGAQAAVVDAAASQRVDKLAVPYLRGIKEASTFEQLEGVLRHAQDDGFAVDLESKNDPVAKAAVLRRRDFVAPAQGGQAPTQPPPVAANPQALERLWQQILMTWPGDRTSDCEAAFTDKLGCPPSNATLAQLEEFLAHLQHSAQADAAAAPVDDDEVPF